MKYLVLLSLFTSLAYAGERPQSATDSASEVLSVVEVKKHQLAVLDIALREMRKTGQSSRGQQAVIEDHGSSFFVAFMDDPIDMAVAGSQNGITWEIRKRDLKVLRRILGR
jgi:hypothetical protein